MAAVSTLLTGAGVGVGGGLVEVVDVVKEVGLGVLDGVGVVLGVVSGVVLGKVVETEISQGRGAIWIAVR